MKPNPLIELQKLGQSIWYDNIRRALITSGDLQKKIEEDDLRGVTSNPAIFEKAIAGSTDYKDAIRDLAGRGKSTLEIYEDLAINDIQMAADLLLPVYKKTNRIDGYISLEVSPFLAQDTQGTINEARRLWKTLGRKNAMIKVPATPEGLPAIEQLIADGINVNVTLIFSQDAYIRVAEAYIRGLEKRAAAGQPLDHVASVASFFVSRIDSSVDSQLGFKIRHSTNQAEIDSLTSLLGKTAIANAKLAYQKFKEMFGKEPFTSLKKKGAQVQRPLWASTGTKDPNYSDVLYVETLIGPDTVNTVPPATYTAFRDHGQPALTLEQDVKGAQAVMTALDKTGISLSQVTSQLLDDAVRLFVEPFEKLLKAIEEQRAAAMSIVDRQIFTLGNFVPTFEKAMKVANDRQYVHRMWRKDPTVWDEDPAGMKVIQNSLGWLTIPDVIDDQVDDLKASADRARNDGFESIMLIGMGGSGLCPQVYSRTFGQITGFPKFFVMDSVDPASIRAMEAQIDPAKTLFIISSKSGATIEPRLLFQYFFDRVSKAKPDRPGANFIAITDSGTPLEKTAHDKQFRRVFINPADIVGRYAALSYLGMVPAAMMGIDIKESLARAVEALQACEQCVPIEENPGTRLGALIGSLANHHIDKVTLITPPPLNSLGLWIEQLIAESTGKKGQGILTVSGEPLGDSGVYEHDRLFVYIRLKDAKDEQIESKLKELEQSGHPVVRHTLRDSLSLGREFYLWEVATAIAGAMIGVNPFDQPNLEESRQNTRALLNLYQTNGKLPSQTALWEGDGMGVYSDEATQSDLKSKIDGGGLKQCLAAHLNRASLGDYVALTAFVQENDQNEKLLQQIRTHIRDVLKTATSVGYGPRFLHSTGQMHKGGRNNGVFIQITSDDAEDLSIPGETYTFGMLKQALALGDFQALANRGRRVIRFHAGRDVASGLETLLQGVREALPVRK